MATLEYKANDTKPELRVQLGDASGPYVIPSGADVYVCIRGTNGTSFSAKIACVVENAASGIIRYDRNGAEKNTPGDYFYEFEVSLGGVPLRTFPTVSYLPVRIYKDLG